MAVTCASCAAENPDGKRFCGSCGSALGRACLSCDATLEAGQRFCFDCGTPVDGAGTTAEPTASARSEPERRVAERRLVSVLFGDLVGFTSISESRDPEDVRDLLSQYFAMASTVVGRYGGTIE